MGCTGEADEVGFTNLPVAALHFLRLGCSALMHFKIKVFDPAAVIDLMADMGVTYGGLSPSFAHRLCRYCSEHSRQLPIKLLIVGGAPVYHFMVEQMRKAMVGRRFVIVYGSTEAEPISSTDVETKLAKEAEFQFQGHFVGLPMVAEGVKVIQVIESVSKKLEDVALPVGKIGEIVVTGWHVNIEGITGSRLLEDSKGQQWLKTGDAGYLDKEGNIWLAGRTSWRVQRNGRTYWSIMIEEKVLAFLGEHITLAVYLCHNDQAHLIVEAPNRLPSSQETRLRQFLQTEGIPVDRLTICKTIPRDRRHNSKPDMNRLFPDRKRGAYLTAMVAILLGILGFWWLFRYGSLQAVVCLVLATALLVFFVLHSFDVV